MNDPNITYTHEKGFFVGRDSNNLIVCITTESACLIFTDKYLTAKEVARFKLKKLKNEQEREPTPF